MKLTPSLRMRGSLGSWNERFNAFLQKFIAGITSQFFCMSIHELDVAQGVDRDYRIRHCLKRLFRNFIRESSHLEVLLELPPGTVSISLERIFISRRVRALARA